MKMLIIGGSGLLLPLSKIVLKKGWNIDKALGNFQKNRKLSKVKYLILTLQN